MTTTKTIEQVLPSMRAAEGDGMVIHRAFPGSSVSEIDPFLLLDEMGPLELHPGEGKGFPDHPHRGFETITYLHFTLQPGAEQVQAIPEGYRAMVYLIGGAGVFDAKTGVVKARKVLVFGNDGESIKIANPAGSTEALNFLLIAGKPLDEPV